MKDKKFVLNTALAIVLFVAVLVCVLVRTFVPAAVLPALSIPNMVLLSLVALLADHYLAKDADRCYVCVALFSVLTFGLLPYAAGFVALSSAWKLALMGGVVFTITTWLFTSICDRLSSGPACKAAPIISALGLYFAAQCLTGMIF